MVWKSHGLETDRLRKRLMQIKVGERLDGNIIF